MAFGFDDALLFGGTALATSIGSQLFGSLLQSGGSSGNAQDRLWNNMYEPRDVFGGLSKAQIQQQVDLAGYKSTLAASSAANLDYNKQLPTAMRQGLEAAGYNPMLAVLGNYSPSGISGGTVLSQPNTTPGVRPSRGMSSALNAESIYKMLRGYFDAEQSNTDADTSLKDASRTDVQASANLKNAEAEYTHERAETERALRQPHYEDAVLQSRYGSGWAGNFGRMGETFFESAGNVLKALGNFIVPDASSAKRSDTPTVVVPAVNSSRKQERYMDDGNRPHAKPHIYYHGWH